MKERRQKQNENNLSAGGIFYEKKLHVLLFLSSDGVIIWKFKLYFVDVRCQVHLDSLNAIFLYAMPYTAYDWYCNWLKS